MMNTHYVANIPSLIDAVLTSPGGIEPPARRAVEDQVADNLRDSSYDPSECGPGRHAVGEAFFPYLREPGGNRIELCPGVALVFALD